MGEPVVLIILDGWGIAPPGPGNATTLAHTPNFNSFWSSFPHTSLQASGEAVGLPQGEKGNSETGHLNTGAGRIVYQDLPRINLAIADGSFFQLPAFLEVAAHCLKNNSRLHLMGLVGQGGVHSNIQHLFALLRFAKEKNIRDVYLHLFSDGRDSPQTSLPIYLRQIGEEINKLGIGQIATVVGRYYAMDRDNHWERTEVAYRALTEEKGMIIKNLEEAVQTAYKDGKTDEFLEPLIVEGTPRIKENDSVIFINFRIDRPRQLTKAFVIDDFKNLIGKKIAFDPYTEKYYKKTQVEARIASIFARGPKLKNLFFVTMTEYEKDLPVQIAFPPTKVKLPLGRILSEQNRRQLRIAETEKERFVTYYFNGQQESPFLSEDRLIMPSPLVPTYDQKPEMAALEITKALEGKIRLNVYDFILVNFANPDMVGHTGVLGAGIKSCETVDYCLGRIIPLVKAIGGTVLISADHGNIEEMINLETGAVDTEHSKNPVPFIVVNNKVVGNTSFLPTGILADIAPTVLDLLNIPVPPDMSGRSLLP